MRKTIAPALFLASMIATAVFAEKVTVVIDEAALKKRPQFFAPTVAKAKLGDSFEADAPQDGWYQVSASGKGGYMHQTAVADNRRRLSAGAWQGGTSATAEEVTLAGKGFNESVEKGYRNAHPEVNFRAVDAMEKRTVSDNALSRFAESGGLIPAEEAR